MLKNKDPDDRVRWFFEETGWLLRRDFPPFMRDRDYLILLDMMGPHQLDQWPNDENTTYLVGFGLTRSGKVALAHKLRSIIETRKLHQELIGPDKYLIESFDFSNMDPRCAELKLQFIQLHDSLPYVCQAEDLWAMDKMNISYSLIEREVIVRLIRHSKVIRRFKSAICMQIKLNRYRRTEMALEQVARQKRVMRHKMR